jgi:hypothetical protein
MLFAVQKPGLVSAGGRRERDLASVLCAKQINSKFFDASVPFLARRRQDSTHGSEPSALLFISISWLSVSYLKLSRAADLLQVRAVGKTK